MIRHLYRVLGPEGSGFLNRLLVVLAGAAILQGLAFTLLVPVLRALLGENPGEVWPWLTVLTVCSLAYAALQAVALSSGFTVGSRLSRVLHRRLADRALDLPIGWFTPGRAAELSRLAGQNIIQVMNMPAHLLRPLTSSVLTPLTIVAATFFLDGRVALVLLLCAPLLLAVHLWSTSVMSRLDRGRDTAIGESADRVLEFAQNQPILRAFGRTVDGYGALDDALAAESRADRRLIHRGVPGLVSFAFATRTVFALLLALGVSWTLGGSLDVATLLALLVLVGRLTDSLSSAADLGAGMRIARNSLERLDAVLGRQPFPQPAEPRLPDGADVEFDAVRFGYRHDTMGGSTSLTDPEAELLSDVSFRIPERSMTALIGPSGAGKTTVARLLARFWDTTGGTIRIGGVDVRDITSEDLAATVSIVFQDVYLFEGTIEDNVRVGDPDASEEKLRRAAVMAGLDRVVEEMPDGWATRVGEGGTALSGGQRQRVSIARALLKDAPILILDEATAALDQENEAVLTSTVQALATEKTLLVITHRLSTVLAADQVLVMENGRITERGTHAQLTTADGTYADFWRQRTNADGWRLEVAP
ncbi:ABC transporter ATP-binding protein/permease [Streptosporangium sp. NBC_01755]|uniref:ABC transporter ATP-binding protein n=1 Tax=Streptosporangium sp. NBC_01755 TaxID=2975949 RepID=UPI002DD9B68C|nr:ABC transporter ATP-binding protein [Streptosporangium sp. NBC_01755]WSC99910.1 ABC transporter ATP-binding protein/permease [Streptosporangium sp. NBC_01755]